MLTFYGYFDIIFAIHFTESKCLIYPVTKGGVQDGIQNNLSLKIISPFHVNVYRAS